MPPRKKPVSTEGHYLFCPCCGEEHIDVTEITNITQAYREALESIVDKFDLAALAGQDCGGLPDDLTDIARRVIREVDYGYPHLQNKKTTS